MSEKKFSEKFSVVIHQNRSVFEFNLFELWRYKDLIYLFVYRDFISEYKQTILGPLWFLIKPLIMTVIFTLIFGKMGGLPTSGIPKFLFYLSGIVTWKYFEECVKKISNTFIDNSNIFSKVYFPRLTVSISILISSLLSFGIQFFIFLVFVIYFYGFGSYTYQGMNIFIIIPILFMLIVLMACIGLGLGLLISALTTKYRDLRYLIDFGLQLLMYISPVIIPLSEAKKFDKLKYLIAMNPMTGVIETFRFLFFGGEFYLYNLIYSIVFSIVVLFFGLIVFNRVERNFIDYV
jgi:lipopolysaccharide transport system permease protein